MKKLVLFFAAVLAFSFAKAQEGNLKVGVQAGIPVGDLSKGYSFGAGVNVSYVFAKLIDKLEVGATAGYGTFIGKELKGGFKVENYGYIPVAATGQFWINESIGVGADLGYAIAISPSGAKGGFLYQPKVSYLAGQFEVSVGYQGIVHEKSTSSSINIGLGYRF